MIAYVKGTLTAVEEGAVIVETGGVGYELNVPNPFHFQHELNKQVKIQTYLHVREDAQILYGFKNEDEKYLFTKLISVSGIGPKGALGILSGADISSFVAAVEQEDEKFLTSFPGVGKKTARQIILDLKGKLAASFSLKTPVETIHTEDQTAFVEAKEALKALGYTDKELTPVMADLRKQASGTTDELVRKGLALLLEK
jgi:Holliday junction DNA helicase RuvA